MVILDQHVYIDVIGCLSVVIFAMVEVIISSFALVKYGYLTSAKFFPIYHESELQL